MINEIMSGAAGGIIYSLSGWKATEENFDWFKLSKSMVISGLTGAICAMTGMEFDVAIIGTLGIGVTSLVNKIFTIVKLKLK